MYCWMREDGLSPDRATYSRLISVCAYSPARARDAEALYERLVGERVELDAFMYLHLVTAIASGGGGGGGGGEGGHVSRGSAGGGDPGGRLLYGKAWRVSKCCCAAAVRSDPRLAVRRHSADSLSGPVAAPRRRGRRRASLARRAARAARHADGHAELQGHARPGGPPPCPLLWLWLRSAQ